MDDIQTFTLPAGTVVHRNGIPVFLVADTQISTHVNNWPLIRGDFKPGTGGPLSASDNNSGKQD